MHVFGRGLMVVPQENVIFFNKKYRILHHLYTRDGTVIDFLSMCYGKKHSGQIDCTEFPLRE